MLKTYLISVIIWMIIMYCVIKIFGPRVVENKWTENVTPTMGKFTSLFVMSAVPFFRCLFLFSFLYMASCTKDQFDKKYKTNNDMEEEFMYICLDCDNIFSAPRQFVETHGFDEPPYEEYLGCPYCGGTYIEAYECDRCGQYIIGDYIELNDGSLICDNCYESKNILEEMWI